MVSLTEENYLKALYNLAKSNGEVNITELSKHLGIKMPTANSMIKKLAEKKLVWYESYKPLRLTPQGKKTAALIIRKHRLTEMFLVDKMGFGWEQVHQIAEQIEHIQSEEFFFKMDELLGYPEFDPHGSPIPDLDGKVKNVNYLPLSQCAVGHQLKLQAVRDSSDDFLKFLNSKNLKLGAVITIKSIEPYNRSMTIRCSLNKNEVLTAIICEKLLVTRV